MRADTCVAGSEKSWRQLPSYHLLLLSSLLKRVLEWNRTRRVRESIVHWLMALLCVSKWTSVGGSRMRGTCLASSFHPAWLTPESRHHHRRCRLMPIVFFRYCSRFEVLTRFLSPCLAGPRPRPIHPTLLERFLIPFFAWSSWNEKFDDDGGERQKQRNRRKEKEPDRGKKERRDWDVGTKTCWHLFRNEGAGKEKKRNNKCRTLSRKEERGRITKNLKNSSPSSSSLFIFIIIISPRYRRKRREGSSSRCRLVSWNVLGKAGHGHGVLCECRHMRHAVVESSSLDCRPVPSRHLFSEWGFSSGGSSTETRLAARPKQSSSTKKKRKSWISFLRHTNTICVC